jgi:hypothetical protein
MSKFRKILSSVTGILGMGAPKPPELPTPQVAAAPAPTQNNDTGATIMIGRDAALGDRITGSNKKRKVGDVLGGLGQSSGLRV